MSAIEILLSLLQGLKVTIIVTFFGVVLGFVLAFASGLARLTKFFILRTIAAIYVEVIRGTSLLVQLYWIYFALPILGLRLPALLAGILALGLNAGAYGSEVVRSSILAVPKGQTEASITLNFTPLQRLWRIILPQAFVMMLPAFGNLQIELLKGTALVSLITLADLTYQSNILKASTAQTTVIYALLLVIYFLIAWPMTKGIRMLETKLSAGRY